MHVSMHVVCELFMFVVIIVYLGYPFWGKFNLQKLLSRNNLWKELLLVGGILNQSSYSYAQGIHMCVCVCVCMAIFIRLTFVC